MSASPPPPCYGATDVFFRGDLEPDADAYAPAVHICRTQCPTKTRRLCYEAGRNEPYGVWGGTTPDDRI